MWIPFYVYKIFYKFSFGKTIMPKEKLKSTIDETTQVPFMLFSFLKKFYMVPGTGKCLFRAPC